MTESMKPVLIHPRVDAHLHAALVTFADRTHRSLSGAVNHILSEYLVAKAPAEVSK